MEWRNLFVLFSSRYSSHFLPGKSFDSFSPGFSRGKRERERGKKRATLPELLLFSFIFVSQEGDSPKMKFQNGRLILLTRHLWHFFPPQSTISSLYPRPWMRTHTQMHTHTLPFSSFFFAWLARLDDALFCPSSSTLIKFLANIPGRSGFFIWRWWMAPED